ncbi:MAG TPA: hypothetical protein VMW19_01355 [Myxococcota bacterium]|nr:hypothetical protein [Myxococcota bacterium]
MMQAIPTVGAGSVRCRVCGSPEVHTDRVLDGEELWLAECLHCDHRWTARAAPARLRSVALRGASLVMEETATAA